MAHLAQLYRQGLTTPEVSIGLREGLPDPVKSLRHDPTTILPALVNALERIAQEVSLLRQDLKGRPVKAQTSWEDDDLPFCSRLSGQP